MYMGVLSNSKGLFFPFKKNTPCGSPSQDLYKEKLVQSWVGELIHFKEDRPAALVSGDRFLWNIILIKNACVKPLRIKHCVQQHVLSSCMWERKTNATTLILFTSSLAGCSTFLKLSLSLTLIKRELFFLFVKIKKVTDTSEFSNSDIQSTRSLFMPISKSK